MADSNLIIARLKAMMTEVFELRDVKPDAQARAVEYLKGAINAIHLGRKNASKLAANGPTGFDTAATEYLYGLKPDLESGDPRDDGGWFGLYLGNLSEGSRELGDLPRDDMQLLSRNRGVIIHEGTDGEVTGRFFTTEEDAVDQWDEAISINDSELAHL